MPAIHRLCANARCRRPIPATASPARRHCRAACRQATHRARNPSKPPNEPAPDERTELIDAVHTQAQALIRAVLRVSETPEGDGFCTHMADMITLADALVQAAITHDRATGDTWADIAAHLIRHPESVRRRYGRLPSPADER